MKKTIYTLLALLAVTVAGAQTSKHEISVNGFGGIQGITGSLSNGGSFATGIGGGGGIGYHYNLNKSWSIGTGVDFSFYSATMEYAQLRDEHTGYDAIEETDFRFTAEATDFEESASALLLEIPLTARYSLPVGSSSLRLTGGFKFGLPLSGNYTASAKQLHTEGYSEYEGVTYQEIPGVFVDEPMAEHTGTFEAGLSVQLTVEAAYRIVVAEKYGLSLGVYFNYGLNDMQSKSDGHPVAFDINGNKPYTSNSLLTSNLASSLRPMAFGVKLRFDLGL